MKSVVYLDCPAAERADTERTLADAGVSVVWADDVTQALSELQRRDMPVVIDLSRGTPALAQARELKSRRASTLMFAVVDAGRPDLTIEAIPAGFADIFARPLGGRRVARAIERELRHDGHQQTAAPGQAEAEAEELYAYSRAMRHVKALIARAATMRVGVLICGEPGTGRRMVARNIHAAEGPKAPAFVPVDCAAGDAGQVESALFGHPARPPNGETVRGLEGVNRDSRLFAAHGGTLYLQNITEMSARLQTRVSRVLRDREAILAETGEVIGLDVRPVTAVDPGVDIALKEGRLRDDLIRRLSVIRIDMPPLRSRREDIPALANYFARRIAAGRRIPPKVLSRPALSLMAALPWRGNADELHAMLEQVMTGLGDVRVLGIDHVLAHIRLDAGSVGFANRGTLRQARVQFEREYIAAVLEQHRGRISEAAKALGIQRTNLYRKMRTLQVFRGADERRRAPFGDLN